MAKVRRTLKRRRPVCPKCGSSDVVPIVYGYPLPEMMGAAKRGEIELGGCCVTDEDPTLYCKACGVPFGAPKARAGTKNRARRSKSG